MEERRFRGILIAVFFVNLVAWLTNIWLSVTGVLAENLWIVAVYIVVLVPPGIFASILVWRDAKSRARKALGWALFTYFAPIIAIPVYLLEAKEGRLPPIPSSLIRTEPRNPDGLVCPRCGSTRLIVENDGSAFCLDGRHAIRQLSSP